MAVRLAFGAALATVIFFLLVAGGFPGHGNATAVYGDLAAMLLLGLAALMRAFVFQEHRMAVALLALPGVAFAVGLGLLIYIFSSGNWDFEMG